MRISILSDFHLGYTFNAETSEDSFISAAEALEKALDSDIIILAGDIFHSKVPTTAVWAKAIKILVKPLLQPSSGVELVECSKELKEVSRRTLNHLPVVAIHGTHERRGKGEITAIQALENAGLLIHLHRQTIVFEKNGVRVAIHGMSSVPERFAKDILYQWNPQPLQDCFNILLLHQNIHPFVYSPLEPPSLTLSNIPRNFQLIVDGHIHVAGQEKINGGILLFPGSTIVTQLQPNEAQQEKGFYKIEINDRLKTEFVPLQTNRKFIYEEVNLTDEKPVREQIENRLKEIIFVRVFKKPPLIKIRLVGKGLHVSEQELREIERKYSGKAIISFSKELESPEIAEKLEFLRNLREQKMSIEEIGLNLLRKNLDELKFSGELDYEKLFNLLADKEVDRVFNILIGQQKTLFQYR